MYMPDIPPAGVQRFIISVDIPCMRVITTKNLFHIAIGISGIYTS